MISIIIPVFNAHEMTQECIGAVRDNTQDYEIVIVDNGSTPPIIGATIRNESNLGFPVAVNQGIRAAKGEVIFLLNNDVIVTPGWASMILKHLEKADIVAPMSNYCAGMQRIVLPVYRNRAELDTTAKEFMLKNPLLTHEVNWIIGFCMVFRKSLYDKLGPFDESLWPCSGEEIDFCLRSRAAGYKIGIANNVYIHHHGSQTFAEMQKDGCFDYDAIITRNNTHLSEKWGADFFYRQDAN